MNNERVLLILRNIKLLVEQLKLEIDDEYYFERTLVNSMESNIKCIETMFGKHK